MSPKRVMILIKQGEEMSKMVDIKMISWLFFIGYSIKS
jgi:hypothetical protein